MITKEITCPSCHIRFVLGSTPDDLIVNYCPFCRKPFFEGKQSTLALENHNDLLDKKSPPSVSFLPEHLPILEHIQFTIGPYQVLQSIGKGGMGEVFLAYDTTCGRRLALKQIRPDLKEHKQLYNQILQTRSSTSTPILCTRAILDLKPNVKIARVL